jgi:hypothetical protein
MMPIDHSELQLDMSIFDLIHQLRLKQSGRVTEEHHRERLEELTRDPSKGLFSSFYSGVGDNQIEEHVNEQFNEVAMSTLMYEHQMRTKSVRSSTHLLISAMFYGILSGKTYLGDISRVYMRILQGELTTLEDLKLMFN